jgi:plasmid stabilization system protein ParE
MTVRWMPLAEQDLEAAYDCGRQENANSGACHSERSEESRQSRGRKRTTEILRFAQNDRFILSFVGMLIRHPFAGPEGRVKGTRELVVARTPYIVAYRIHEAEIQILAVLHGAQRWPSAFSTS